MINVLKLIEGDKKYLEGYNEAYILSKKKVEEGVIKKHNRMFENIDEVDVIQKMKDASDETKLPEGWVKAYQYFAVDDDKFVGLLSIRTRLTDNLLKYGGHIGYAVNPKYWNMGYGTKILELGLKIAKEIGINKVLITCDDDNIGSYRIIEKNGGALENKVENTDQGETFLTRRYWIDL